jgi:hypothetical protein
MSYTIILTSAARDHIRYLLRQGVMNRGEQSRSINAIAARLTYQPAMAQGHVKSLRQPNVLNVSFELRVQPWRVFFTVDETAKAVRIEAIGFKVRARLLIEGQEVEL